MSSIIAIVGRPNVGKSTLFNRLSRSRDALVDDRPGITRDRLYATINYGNSSITLVDTGGLEGSTDDPIVKKVHDQVMAAVAEADRIIFMVDARQGILPGDDEIADLLRGFEKKVFLAANKVDGPEHEHLITDFYKFGITPIFPVSAAHGYGVRALMDAITADLPPEEPIDEDTGHIRVAVLGKPNVGKSSLINRLLGSERLVVSDVPGTTRDAVDTFIEWNGKSFLFIDTAGIRKKARVKEKIEKFSVLKALRSLDRCHIACILVDAKEGVTDQDAKICGYAFEKRKGIVLVVNKWDLVKGDPERRRYLEDTFSRHLHFIPFAPRINVSALTGEKVLRLFDQLNKVYEHFSLKINTSEINKALQQIIQNHPPPRTGHRRPKFSYGTQVRTCPPTFLLFVNRPDWINVTYERYLANQFRLWFNLKYTPVKLIFRKKS